MATSVVRALPNPLVLAPLAGGPSTPELTAAAADAGAFAFLAAGYLSPDALAERLRRTRALTSAAIGVNLFAPGARAADASVVQSYADAIRPEADALGVALGAPRFDDDHWHDKLDVLLEDAPAVVSFTFGCPPTAVIERVHRAGAEVWVTVTTVDEAVAATGAGADAVVAQGIEAGGHRGTWRDDDAGGGLGLLALVQLVRARVDVPIVATGGIATGRGIAAATAAGADAAALGTAFLRCPEAGTSAVHRAALAGGTAPTALTRAFTGRLARGIVNRFLERYSAVAPSAYPEVHHLTAPLRQAGRDAGDGEVVNLWAGQAYALAAEVPAAEVVNRLLGGARSN